MSDPLVSVIVPIYNTEQWLDDCILSITSQTYAHLEIILIDDGSTDKCSRICDSWMQKDQRIRVIHKENEGLGFTRNMGMNLAHGKYLCFVDSDDMLYPYAIQEAVSCALANRADLVSFACHVLDTQGRRIRSIGPKSKESYVGNAVINEFLPRLLYGDECCFSAWALLYSTELIQSAGWQLVSERKIISEDYYSLLDLMPYVQKVVMLPEVLYQYRLHPDSLSGQYRTDRFLRCRHCYEEMKALCIRKHYPQTVCEAVGIPFLNNSMGVMKQLFSAQGSQKERYMELRCIIKDSVLQDVLSKLDLHGMSWQKHLFCLFLRQRWYWLCFLLLTLQCRKENYHASPDS